MKTLHAISSKLSRALTHASLKSHVGTSSQFRSISSTQLASEQMKIKVPEMGDSITEGTVIEWAAQVGQAVKVDDVVALIETDKVTIDIKAQMDGVIVEHFAGVDDEVEVGSDLYMIDSEGVATATTADITLEASADDTSASAVQNSGEEIAAAKPSKPGVRVPSIQFLGKDGWKQRMSVAGAATTPAPTQPLKPHGSTVLPGGPLSPMYGRLPFTEREIEDCVLGGAAEAPYSY
jgi:biotin carboxyl carrier protein